MNSSDKISGPSFGTCVDRSSDRAVWNSQIGTLNATASNPASAPVSASSTSGPTRIATRIRLRPIHHLSPGRYTCHDPLISMCVTRIRSPEKNTRHHFPRDSTFSTTRPFSGVSSFTRAIGARLVSNPTTCRPTSAFPNARAARYIVSPSGMACYLPFPRQTRQ